jgi:cation diffusion facilitator CzcD-associated flavoprotein CzcO
MVAGVKRVRIAVVGAGVSGLCAGVHLKQAGEGDFVILEKAADLGGAWRDNTYPGVECDVPSHLYSYSFDLNPDWSREFPSGAEIHAYLHGVAERHGLAPHMTFGAQVSSAAFAEGRWRLTLASGEVWSAQFLICAVGGLHVPKYPGLPGAQTFQGPAFHAACWRHDVDLAGKRVVLIGTGATAVQCGPRLAEIAERLSVVQRSPVWVGPKANPEIPAEERARLRADPAALRKKRWDLWKSWEANGAQMIAPGSALIRKLEQRAVRHLGRQVADPQIAAALTPDYSYTCKRPTISDHYYAMFGRPNVELVQGGVDRVEPHAVVMEDGRRLAADVLVYATGFKAFDISQALDLRGEDGVALRELWRERIVSYRTVMAPGMPNLFMLLGPNTAGLTSAYQMIEAECAWVVRALGRMHAHGHAVIAPKRPHADRFCDEVQAQLARTTLNRGCVSWWSDGKGYGHANWPSSSVEYRLMLQRFAPDHFDFRQGAHAA